MGWLLLVVGLLLLWVELLDCAVVYCLCLELVIDFVYCCDCLIILIVLLADVFAYTKYYCYYSTVLCFDLSFVHCVVCLL